MEIIVCGIFVVVVDDDYDDDDDDDDNNNNNNNIHNGDYTKQIIRKFKTT